jgi:hypothetical protein
MESGNREVSAHHYLLSYYLLVVYSFCVCVGKVQLLIKLLSANTLRTD